MPGPWASRGALAGRLRNSAVFAIRPRYSIRRLSGARPPGIPAVGSASIVGIGILYSLSVAVFASEGAEPVARPVIPIDREDYYAWLRFLTIPTFVAVWLIFGTVAHMAARALGGRGERVRMLDFSGLAVSLPMLITMWVPETVMALLLAVDAASWEGLKDANASPMGSVLNNGRQVAGVVWMTWLVAMSAWELHRLTPLRALAAAIAGLVPAAVVSLIVIR